ncbi:unnamed protein product [Rotaria sordida]|uniref:Uncharacterized protein n=1 Tax=Rotaria sordida TaxID=392033 RepID=A0A816CI84_9BILA|nr:unnamed protein product [Rotaria sordida]CAF1624881.1 unnamed protein product [Rotaria sordida]
MDCGRGRTYTEKHINNCQSRLPSAELIDNNIIKLISYDRFFNSSSLLDSTWLKGKIINNEYRQAIKHINRRIGQSLIGTLNNLPINQISITQFTILAIEELHAKYAGRIHFVYKKNDQPSEFNTPQSFIFINSK